jgi:hypothetical protein
MPLGGRYEASFTQVPHARLLATGDLHAHRQTRATGSTGQALVALSPGNLYLQASDEDPDKFVYVLYADGTFESVGPLLGRPSFCINVVNRAQLEGLLRTAGPYAPDGRLPPELRTPALFVRFARSLTDAPERLRKAFGEHAHLFVRAMPGPAPADDDEARAGAPAADAGDLIRHALKSQTRDMPWAEDAFLRIAAAPDVRAEAREVLRGWSED